MKIGIMQPYFMPYIGYWQLINAVDKYVVYDDVNYIKKGWINRNNVLVNHQAKLFTISLKGASQNKLINEIEIADDFSNFLKLIEYNYSKAPYFSQTYNLLKEIISFESKNLALFLYNSIVKVCSYLDIQTEIILSSDIPKDNSLKGQDKILEICKLLRADTYINAIGGKELYDKNIFSQQGVSLFFLQSETQPYIQGKIDFVPYLSLIDILMWNDINIIKEMLRKYTFC